MTEKEFKKLKKDQRYRAVKLKGEFIASRFYEGFHVHLYIMEGLRIEVWQRVGLEIIEYIEILRNKDVLDEYLGGKGFNDLIGGVV